MELDIGVTHSDLTLDESWFASDTSTGYLEDAITSCGIWCKEHNLPFCSRDQKEDLFPTFSFTAAQILQDRQKISTRNPINPSSSQNHTHAAVIKHDSSERSCASIESDEKDAALLRGQWKKIAYPFELVKPGGIGGETTLEDINHHILTNPSKPIPHPVGDSVTHPCISNSGYGISGKAVASLTRIHTRGRGSITIIRTKG